LSLILRTCLDYLFLSHQCTPIKTCDLLLDAILLMMM